ncbi:hypothetical protein AB6A40_011367 [Gnathostoma spinigerum]|uniref:Uncharacterized protein n=1 Tax=Gnathostoma spinigerum TaxID=75299 RepID=A0ABD6F3E2_9BILA
MYIYNGWNRTRDNERGDDSKGGGPAGATPSVNPSFSMSIVCQIALVVLLAVIGEGKLTRNCVTPLSTTKCQITWK